MGSSSPFSSILCILHAELQVLHIAAIIISLFKHVLQQESPAVAVKPARRKSAKIAPIRRVSLHFTECHFSKFQITNA